jgi:hypothetical protein
MAKKKTKKVRLFIVKSLKIGGNNESVFPEHYSVSNGHVSE